MHVAQGSVGVPGAGDRLTADHAAPRGRPAAQFRVRVTRGKVRSASASWAPPACHASLAEDLAEPEDRCLAELPGNLVDCAAVADAVAQPSELIESFSKDPCRAKAALERRPERFADDRVLQFAEIEILKLSGQGLVMVRVDGGILSGLRPGAVP